VGRGRDKQLETGLLSDDELAQLRAARSVDAPTRRTSLLLYHRDGVEVVQLGPGASVVIGRASPADIALGDSSLSRQHVTVEVVDGEVWVEDLQSTNGTWVDAERVERVRVTPASEIAFGAVSASVHVAGTRQDRPLDLDPHDRFVGELEAEVARARASGHGTSLALVRGVRAGSLARWIDRVREPLRPFDRVALYSSDTVELLLPETNADEARGLLEGVLGQDDSLRAGLAALPQHAGSAGELLAVAVGALHRAEGAGPLHVPPMKGPGGGDDGEEERPVVGDPVMKRVFDTARRVSRSIIPVLLVGETGVGKEVVARAIHEGGDRAGGPMICVNCGAIPDQLVESTLFGHEKGAFTGAERRNPGVFESADGGTVLLDEVGELPAPAQAALLRVLETRKFTRVGSSREIEVDVRVLAATHRDLDAMCAEGAFRQDLLYRLNALVIHVPPVRERPSEIESLVESFVRQACRSNKVAQRGVTNEAMQLLRRHSWPGNVRELRNAIERAVVIAWGSEIGVEDLPEAVQGLAQRPGAEAETVEMIPAPSTSAGELDGNREINLRSEVGRYESALILAALKAADWDRKEAARRLGLPVRTMAHKMKSYGIHRKSYVQDDE
jgi:two-component system, NtrC family, response regulator AtoC